MTKRGPELRLRRPTASPPVERARGSPATLHATPPRPLWPRGALIVGHRRSVDAHPASRTWGSPAAPRAPAPRPWWPRGRTASSHSVPRALGGPVTSRVSRGHPASPPWLAPSPRLPHRADLRRPLRSALSRRSSPRTTSARVFGGGEHVARYVDTSPPFLPAEARCEGDRDELPRPWDRGTRQSTESLPQSFLFFVSEAPIEIEPKTIARGCGRPGRELMPKGRYGATCSVPSPRHQIFASGRKLK